MHGFDRHRLINRRSQDNRQWKWYNHSNDWCCEEFIRYQVNDWTNHIALRGIRPNLLLKVLMYYDILILILKDDNLIRGFLWSFANGRNCKVTRDVEDKQGFANELIPLERCVGKKIMVCLWNVFGSASYCCAFLFKWINEHRRSNEKARNEAHPGRPYRSETHAVIWSILQEGPNPSLETTLQTLSILLETIHRHMLRIDHTLKTLHWIPQALTSKLKPVRLTMCLQFLSKLRAHAHDHWRHFVKTTKARSITYVRERT
jgi:hypothetical protein